MFSRQAVRLNRPTRLRPGLQASSSPRGNLVSRRYLRYDSKAETEWSYYSRRMIIAVGIFGVALYTLKTVADKYFIVHWPVRVKANAKAALLAERRGDTKEAVKYGSRAWLACLEADPAEFGPDPYLTISGIALMYSQQCIDAGKKKDARQAIERTYNLMIGKEKDMSDLEKFRVIGLATRLAELLEAENNEKDAESWYSNAVTHSLGWFKVSSESGSKDETIIFPAMMPSLTSWLFDSKEKEHLKPDPSAPFVNIARLYSRQGRVDEAIQCFIYAIQIKNALGGPLRDLLPSTEDKCSAALLMAELAEVILRVNEEVEKPMKVSKEYQQAASWAEKGYDIAEKYIQEKKQAGRRVRACDEACAAAALCLGAFYERTGAYENAAGAYKRVLDLPDDDDLSLPKTEAAAGLKRVILLHKRKGS